MTFAQFNLNSNISKALSLCGYTDPTPVQIHSIPIILCGRDLVVNAQTGTGKTAAFAVPALHRMTIAKQSLKGPRVLILTPTRELAAQINQSLDKYGKFVSVKLMSIVGGASYRRQLQGLARTVDIIIATPGRLLDLMQRHRLNLSTIEMLILDEADRMLDMGFIEDVSLIAKATPTTRQTLLFSATVDGKVGSVIKKLLKNPVHVNLSHEQMAPAIIEQEIYVADNFNHKMRLLKHFIDQVNMYKAIIFSATKVNADKLGESLRAQGHAAAVLHGDLKQNQRNKTIADFLKGKIQFLVATDVAARGLNIHDVTHVINFDSPKFAEDYVHRIGRTGRAGKEGKAITFILPNEMKCLQKIERFIKQTLPISTIVGLEAKQSLSSIPRKKPRKKTYHKRKKIRSHHKSSGSQTR